MQQKLVQRKNKKIRGNSSSRQPKMLSFDDWDESLHKMDHQDVENENEPESNLSPMRTTIASGFDHQPQPHSLEFDLYSPSLCFAYQMADTNTDWFRLIYWLIDPLFSRPSLRGSSLAVCSPFSTSASLIAFGLDPCSVRGWISKEWVAASKKAEHSSGFVTRREGEHRNYANVTQTPTGKGDLLFCLSRFATDLKSLKANSHACWGD